MFKAPLAGLAAAVLFAGIASAQTGTTSTTTTTTTITPQQETAIKTYVTKEKTKSINAPSGFTVTEGATVPKTVELHRFGSDVGLSQYDYVVMDNRTVLVDPQTRKVIRIVH